MNKSDHSGADDAPLSYRGARRIVGLVVLLVVGAFILHSLESVLLLFAVVFLLAMVLNPIVVSLQRRGIPRVLAVVLVILALIVVAGTIVLFAIPPLANQINGMVQSAPHVWQGIRARMIALAQSYPAVRNALPQADEIAQKIGAAAGTVAKLLLRSTIGLVGGVLRTALAILLLIFLLDNPEPLVAAYLAFSPDTYR